MDTIHADIKGQIIEYDQSLDVTIENNIGFLDASLRSFLEMLSKEGSSTDDINKLMDLVKGYNELWEKIDGELKDNTEISTQDKSLLSIIEAARAGEHGKGFGVVADEVNK